MLSAPNHPLWIVVANASRARIMERVRPGEPLLQREDRVHPASRQHAGATERDGPGQTIAGRSGLAPRTDPRTRERRSFAHELATCLQVHARDHAMGSLVVYASKPFMGALLAELDPPLQRRVHLQVGVDMTTWPLAQIEDRLQRDLHAR